MTDLSATLQTLRTQHLSANKRRPDTAIDVPSARWLCDACEREDVRTVLELGSGFSSWALRTWQQSHPSVVICTVDDEARWLNTTRIELDALHLRTDCLFSLAYLIAFDPPPLFDLVFVDLDSPATRVALASQILRWLRPNGLLILDDWQFPHYREPMGMLLNDAGFTVTPHPETIDQWGRYMASARQT